MAPVERNQPHLDRALARLDALVAALGACGHPPARVAWVCFSQGACLACEYVLRHPQRWGAVVAFTGGVLGPAGARLAPTGDLGGTPVLLATADPDPWVPVGRVRETSELFRAMNAAVDERVYPGLGHEVSDEEIQAARALLSSRLTAAGGAR
jgi:phospholipase/carboxylesterase